jgi:hypothetical protein
MRALRGIGTGPAARPEGIRAAVRSRAAQRSPRPRIARSHQAQVQRHPLGGLSLVVIRRLCPPPLRRTLILVPVERRSVHNERSAVVATARDAEVVLLFRFIGAPLQPRLSPSVVVRRWFTGRHRRRRYDVRERPNRSEIRPQHRYQPAPARAVMTMIRVLPIMLSDQGRKILTSVDRRVPRLAGHGRLPSLCTPPAAVSTTPTTTGTYTWRSRSRPCTTRDVRQFHAFTCRHLLLLEVTVGALISAWGTACTPTRSGARRPVRPGRRGHARPRASRTAAGA